MFVRFAPNLPLGVGFRSLQSAVLCILRLGCFNCFFRFCLLHRQFSLCALFAIALVYLNWRRCVNISVRVCVSLIFGLVARQVVIYRSHTLAQLPTTQVFSKTPSVCISMLGRVSIPGSAEHLQTIQTVYNRPPKSLRQRGVCLRAQGAAMDPC